MATLLGYLSCMEGGQPMGLVLYQENNSSTYLARVGSWVLDSVELNTEYLMERGAYFPLQGALAAIGEKGKKLPGFPEPQANSLFVSGEKSSRTQQALRYLEEQDVVTKEYLLLNYAKTREEAVFTDVNTLSADEQNAFLEWLYREVFTAMLLVGEEAVEELDDIMQREEEHAEQYAAGTLQRKRLLHITVHTLSAHLFTDPVGVTALREGLRRRTGGIEYTLLTQAQQNLLSDQYQLTALVAD